MFSFFGKIYCLNLISRHDRYEHSQLVFKKLRCPVEFFRVKRHPSSGAQGCFESHIKMINKAYDLDAPNVLIFEDDLIYNPISYTVLQRAIDFMSGRKDWDIFYLGACPSPFIYTRKVRGYEDIYQTRGPCTHAYVVNRKTMHKMKDLKYEGTAIDNYIEKNMRCFAVYPTLFFQGRFRHRCYRSELYSKVLHASNIKTDDHANTRDVRLPYRCPTSYHSYFRRSDSSVFSLNAQLG